MLRRGWKAQPQETTIVQNEASFPFQDLPPEMQVYVFSFLPAEEQIKASWTCLEHRAIIYNNFGTALLEYQTQVNEERYLNSFFSTVMDKVETYSDSLLPYTANPGTKNRIIERSGYAGFSGGILAPIFCLPPTVLSAYSIVLAGIVIGGVSTAMAAKACTEGNNQINHTLKENKQIPHNSFTLFTEYKKETRQSVSAQEVNADEHLVTYAF